MPGSLPHSPLSLGIHIVGSAQEQHDLSIAPPAAPKNEKIFGLNGGQEARGPKNKQQAHHTTTVVTAGLILGFKVSTQKKKIVFGMCYGQFGLDI